MAEVNIWKDLLRQIEQLRKSKAVLYVTGDRRGLEIQIENTSAAWNLVNLIHMFCDDFEIISPAKCMSAGTLISLGANRIAMTKQATLGPIGPTIQHLSARPYRAKIRMLARM